MKRSKLLHFTFSVAAAALFTGSMSQSQDEVQKSEAPDATSPPEVESNTNNQASFLFEYFQLDHRTANRLIREYSPKAADAGALRNLLGDMVESGDARLIETGWLRCQTGQRSLSQAIREDIYPTEFDPPEIPLTVGDVTIIDTDVSVDEKRTTGNNEVIRNKSTPNPNIPRMTSAMPVAFETRNVGLAIEVDPVIGLSRNMVVVNLLPHITQRLEDQYYTNPDLENTVQGTEHIHMPLFFSMRITTQVHAVPEKYNLIGIHTPHDNPQERILVMMQVQTFRAH